MTTATAGIVQDIHHLRARFIASLTDRLLDMATSIDGWISIDEYQRWVTEESIRHLASRQLIRDAMTASWQDAWDHGLNSPEARACKAAVYASIGLGFLSPESMDRMISAA